MSAEAQLRIGSLEILAALVIFGAVASRMRPYSGVLAGRARRLHARAVEYIGASRVQRHHAPAHACFGRRLSDWELGPLQHRSGSLRDPEVSRRHAEFDVERGVLYLTDLHSSNGTFLNGKRLGDEGIEVRPGDDIDVGNTRITVVDAVQQTWT